MVITVKRQIVKICYELQEATQRENKRKTQMPTKKVFSGCCRKTMERNSHVLSTAKSDRSYTKGQIALSEKSKSKICVSLRLLEAILADATDSFRYFPGSQMFRRYCTKQ